jgi:uncharacterized protein (DUF1919 family)
MVGGPFSPADLRWRFEQIETHRRRIRLREAVSNRHFSIIACNCWGGYVYQDLGIPYQTPFVNLYLHPPCFLGLLENFAAAIRAPLEFVAESRYNGRLPFPVGLILGTFEIHFMHYGSPAEALQKWNRRRDRLARETDDCYFMLMHLDAKRDDVQRFDQLPFRNKVQFTPFPLAEAPSAVVVPPLSGVLDLDYGPTLYRRCHRYFDLARWLNKDACPSAK